MNSQKYLKFTLCLIANSEFGDSNLVLLMNIGVSNLVIVFQNTEAGVSMRVSLILVLVI